MTSPDLARRQARSGLLELQGLRRWALVTDDAHGLYARFGFEPLAEPRRHMELVAAR